MTKDIDAAADKLRGVLRALREQSAAQMTEQEVNLAVAAEEAGVTLVTSIARDLRRIADAAERMVKPK